VPLVLHPDVPEDAPGQRPADGPASKGHAPASTRAWNGNHRIDLRVSIPVPTGRWYVTIVAGPERRSAQRLRAEGQTHWLRQAAIYAMLMALMLWLVVCVFGLVYLLKSALGIDLFEGNSPFHALWEVLFE
jgi:hypothetical protein